MLLPRPSRRTPVLAAVVMARVFRSGRIGLIAVVCNGLPVLLVYSVWAVLDGHISLGAAVVMGMILGIVVDDTVYLLTAERRAAESGSERPWLQASPWG